MTHNGPTSCALAPIRSPKLLATARCCGLPAQLGQYRIDRLLDRFGPDIALPDLRHELTQCPHRGSMSEPCQVSYLNPIDSA